MVDMVETPLASSLDSAPAQVLILPRFILATLQRFFAPYARRRVETVALLCGIEREHESIVTTLAFPEAKRAPRHYEVNRTSMSAAARELARSNMVVLAQAHTHPEDWVGHSKCDDTHAYSTRDGALSLVWPRYGRGSPPLDHVGILELREGTWQQLAPLERDTRIRVVQDILDYRSG